MDLGSYSTTWTRSDDGLWYAAGLQGISYPSDGNDMCFQVEDRSFWFQHRNVIIECLFRHFGNQAVLWDVGGGNGYVCKGLQDAGVAVVLVEPGSDGVRNARLRGIRHVVQSMWTPDIVKQGSVQAIGLFDVIEHIKDDSSFLIGVQQTLAPDGVVFITVPALHSLWSYEDVYSGHFRRYRRSELQRLLSKSGFRVEYCSYFFSMLPLPIAVLRTLPWFLGRKRTPTMESAQKEHSGGNGFAGQLMNGWLRWEQKRVAALKRIWTGSSCVIVGRKR